MVVKLSKDRCPICGGEMSYKAKMCWKCRKKQISKTCPVCGKIFTYKASENRKTCSIKCSYILRGENYRKNYSKKVTKKCLYCGKSFKVSPSKDNSKFCSKECHYKYHTGENSVSWKGGISPERAKLSNTPQWKNAVKAVWTRDDATCQRCHKKYTHDMKSYEIHHIISFVHEEFRTDVDNLVLLCRDCHRWVHSKKNINKEFIKNYPL